MKCSRLKLKIILICSLCTILVGVFSNLYLYSYFTGIIAERSDELESNNIDYIASNLREPLNLLASLGTICSNDSDVAKVMRYQHLSTLDRKQAALKAQDILTAYMKSYRISAYITRLVAFNEHSINVQTVARTQSMQSDPRDIMALPLFQDMLVLEREGARQVMGLSSALENGGNCFALLAPVFDNVTMSHHGWIYIEINLKWIDEILQPFTGGEYLLLAGTTTFGQKDGELWLSNIDGKRYRDGDICEEANTI